MRTTGFRSPQTYFRVKRFNLPQGAYHTATHSVRIAPARLSLESEKRDTFVVNRTDGPRRVFVLGDAPFTKMQEHLGMTYGHHAGDHKTPVDLPYPNVLCTDVDPEFFFKEANLLEDGSGDSDDMTPSPFLASLDAVRPDVLILASDSLNRSGLLVWDESQSTKVICLRRGTAHERRTSAVELNIDNNGILIHRPLFAADMDPTIARNLNELGDEAKNFNIDLRVPDSVDVGSLLKNLQPLLAGSHLLDEETLVYRGYKFRLIYSSKIADFYSQDPYYRDGKPGFYLAAEPMFSLSDMPWRFVLRALQDSMVALDAAGLKPLLSAKFQDLLF